MISRLTSESVLKNSRKVILGQPIKSLINDAIEITSQNRKEIGLYACGNEVNGVLQLSSGSLRTSSGFNANNFQFNPDIFPSIERSICNRGETLVALMHTHPDGNHYPSENDRRVSRNTGMLGCVIGSIKTACFFGDEDLSVR